MGDYTISDIYQGGYSSFDPKKNLSPVDHPIEVGSFGVTTNPGSANILFEVSSKLSSGAKQIEIEGVSPKIFESIPQDQLKEVNRLSKLTGIDVSVHGPIVEASGISQQGYSESSRAAIERQMSQTVERSHIINPDGGSPVTFHSSAGIPGQIQDKGKEADSIIVIDKESGSMGRIPIKKSSFGKTKGEKIDAEMEINNYNRRRWQDDIRGVDYYRDIGNREISNNQALAIAAEQLKKEGKDLNDTEKQALDSYKSGTRFIDNSYNNLSNLFDTAMRNIPEHQQGILEDFSKRIEPKIKEINTAHMMNETFKEIKLKQELINDGLEVLDDVTPQIIEPLNNFAKDKTTETFSNIALNSYEKYKDKSPIISIENPPAGDSAFSTGEELKNIVEESRDKFVKKAVEKGIMSEMQARKQAEKILGVTWDVGHINMLRKFGYDDKDLIKESEKIAPLLKHIHLSDNFGFEHTELPMGMGNVPMKEHLEKLGKKGVEAKKIIEAASYGEHFKNFTPLQQTIEAFGSPIYSMKMEPYWNQSQGFQQGYESGYGNMLPSQHFQTYGSGFSSATLPTELGGQMPGTQGSRMSGRPME